MAVNKVVYGSETLIDVSDTTVTPETLLEGTTAIDAAGNKIVGKVKPVNCYFKTENETLSIGSMTFA